MSDFLTGSPKSDVPVRSSLVNHFTNSMGIFALTGILLALFTSTINSEDGNTNDLNNVNTNKTDEEATANITITANSTHGDGANKTSDAGDNVKGATTDTKIPAKNTTEEATSYAVGPANNTTQEATIDTTVSANNTVEDAMTDTITTENNSTEQATTDTTAAIDTTVSANNTDNGNTTKPNDETTASITITGNGTHGDGDDKTADAGEKHDDGANGTDAGDKDNVDTATLVERATTETTNTANNSTEQAATDTTVPADNTPDDGANGTTVAADMDDVNTIKPDEGTTANTIKTANITDMPKATTETTTTKKPDDETTTKATTTTTYPFSSTTASGDDKKDTEPPPPEPVVNEWYLSFITSANVSDYELDELLYDYLQTKGGKKTLELAKPLLYNLLEGLLFPSEDESKDDKGGNATTTTTETSPMTLMLQESLLPLVNVILTPDENGTSSIDDIITVFEPYLNESLGPTVEPPQIAGFSLDPETPNGKTFLRLATKFFRTKRITVPLGDYLRQVVELTLNKDNSINYKDALLEAAIHAFSCPSSEDLLNELAVFLLKDVILESTDLVSCGLTSALDYLLAALAGKASSSSTEISLPLTDGTIEKLKNLGKDIILQALEMADTRKIFRQLKYLFNQSGLPLPGDKLVYVALRAAVTSEGIGSVGGLTFVDLMEAVNASGLKLSSVGESLLLSVATSEDAPPAFFNIFDMFPVLAREVPALSNLPDMNFVDLLADIL
ncbi:hypothetical protein AAHC03_016672 [Spirometra sp. Aus1]